jgi:dCMP deaminase
MAITIGIKKIICLDSYPETDYDLIEEAGVTITRLEKNKIEYWAKKLIGDYKAELIPK